MKKRWTSAKSTAESQYRPSTCMDRNLMRMGTRIMKTFIAKDGRMPWSAVLMNGILTMSLSTGMVSKFSTSMKVCMIGMAWRCTQDIHPSYEKLLLLPYWAMFGNHTFVLAVVRSTLQTKGLILVNVPKTCYLFDRRMQRVMLSGFGFKNSMRQSNLA